MGGVICSQNSVNVVYGCPQKYLFGLLETQYLHLARERVNARTSRIHGTQLIEKSASFARFPKVQASLTFLKLCNMRMRMYII